MNIQMNEPHGIDICDIQLDYNVIFFYLDLFTIPNSPLNPWTRSMMLLMNILLQLMSITICHSFKISNVNHWFCSPFPLLVGMLKWHVVSKTQSEMNFVFMIGYFSTLGSFVEDFNETSSTSFSLLVHTTY